MTLFHRGRLWYWIARDLSQKYTKALLLGLVAGLGLAIGVWRVFPVVTREWFNRVERIGMVGEFTPSTLPLSIQKHISLGLTDIAPDGSVVPALAESWEATDSGKTFVFRLRQDLWDRELVPHE